MILVWVKFLVCVVLVLVFGTQLSRYGDMIGEKTGLSGVWIGLLLLAIVTSLPEIITGMSAVAMVAAPDLALGTLFGSNAFNLFIVAILDMMHQRGPLLSSASRSHVFSAGLGILLIAFAGISIFLSTHVWDGAFSWLGLYSIVLVVVYLLGSRRVFGRESKAVIGDSVALRYPNISAKRVYLGFVIAALVVVGTGTWLATIGDEIATVTGLGDTFVGSLFLALTTSLPELVVAITALRIGAVDMAIADVLGSNMFNIGIGVACFDLFSGSASIFASASASHYITATVVAVMSLTVVAGLLLRLRRKTMIVMSWYAPALVAMYVVGAYFLFHAGLG